LPISPLSFCRLVGTAVTNVSLLIGNVLVFRDHCGYALCFMSNEPSSLPRIYCIGDSHTSFFSGADRIQPDWPKDPDAFLSLFQVLKIGSPLAYSLSHEGSRTRGRERLFEVLENVVPMGSYVLLSFGEIDCRAHVLKQAAKAGVSVEAVIANLVEGYFSVVREVAALGYEVIVYNAIPSRLKAPTKSSQDPEYIAIGTCLERNRVTRLFNQRLSDQCLAHGIGFLSTFDALVDSNGMTNTWYYFDTIHLSQRAMPLTLQALSERFPDWEIGPIDSIRPNAWSRWLDRICKRTRRILKRPPPLRIGQNGVLEALSWGVDSR